MGAALDGKNEAAAGAFLRVYWMFLGHIAIFVGAVLSGGGGFTWRDLLPGLAAATVIAARYRDVTAHHGSTADGRPATMRDVRRFAWIVLVATVALWSVFRLLRWGIGS